MLGDPFQLPPVQGAGYFTAHEPDMMLTEIHRQAADNPIIRMSMEIREGGYLEYGRYDESDRHSEVRRRPRRRGLADQVLVGRNKTRVDYNDRLRELKNHPRARTGRRRSPRMPPQQSVKRLLNGQIWTAVDVKKRSGNRFSMDLMPDPFAASKLTEASARIIAGSISKASAKRCAGCNDLLVPGQEKQRLVRGYHDGKRARRSEMRNRFFRHEMASRAENSRSEPSPAERQSMLRLTLRGNLSHRPWLGTILNWHGWRQVNFRSRVAPNDRPAQENGFPAS